MRRDLNNKADQLKYSLLLLFLIYLPIGFSCEGSVEDLENSANYEISFRSGKLSKCATVNEGSSIILECSDEETIAGITFASYGTAEGSCDSGFEPGSCHATKSQEKVEELCLDKQSCTVDAKNAVFADPCPGTYKRLYIEYTCSGDGGGR